MLKSSQLGQLQSMHGDYIFLLFVMETLPGFGFVALFGLPESSARVGFSCAYSWSRVFRRCYEVSAPTALPGTEIKSVP